MENSDVLLSSLRHHIIGLNKNNNENSRCFMCLFTILDISVNDRWWIVRLGHLPVTIVLELLNGVLVYTLVTLFGLFLVSSFYKTSRSRLPYDLSWGICSSGIPCPGKLIHYLLVHLLTRDIYGGCKQKLF